MLSLSLMLSAILIKCTSGGSAGVSQCLLFSREDGEKRQLINVGHAYLQRVLIFTRLTIYEVGGRVCCGLILTINNSQEGDKTYKIIRLTLVNMLLCDRMHRLRDPPTERRVMVLVLNNKGSSHSDPDWVGLLTAAKSGILCNS